MENEKSRCHLQNIIKMRALFKKARTSHFGRCSLWRYFSVSSSPPSSSTPFTSSSSSERELNAFQRESILRNALYHVCAHGWYVVVRFCMFLCRCIFLISSTYSYIDSMHLYICSTFRTNEALIKGTVDSNLPLTAFATIARGPVELVEYFLMDKKDEVLKSVYDDAGRVSPNDDERNDCDHNTVEPPSLQVVMEKNIDLLQPYLTSWPEALTLLLEPKNIPHTVQLLFQISDELCEASDIRASRLNWYTERASVVVLLCCSELYMLSDDSEGYIDTRYTTIYYQHCRGCAFNYCLLIIGISSRDS